MSTDVARTAATTFAGTLVGFECALAAGAPWGRYAFGGQHAGVLPPQLRVAAGVSAVVWAGAIAAAQAPATATWRRPARRAYAVLAGVGTVMNLASRSRPERLTWTPVAAGLTAAFTRLAQER